MISISVSLPKIDEALLFEGKNGHYLNLILLTEKDKFGNLIVVQPVSKEAYARGERGPAVGIWKEFGAKPGSQTEQGGFNLAKYKQPGAKRRHNLMRPASYPVASMNSTFKPMHTQPPNNAPTKPTLLSVGPHRGFARLKSQPGVYRCRLRAETTKKLPEHADYRGTLLMEGGKKAQVLVWVHADGSLGLRLAMDKPMATAVVGEAKDGGVP
jgi:hypothetical protein